MNIQRRIGALKRELARHRSEVERVKERQAAKDPFFLALPDFVSKYGADLHSGIARLEAEIEDLEKLGKSASPPP